MRARRVRLLLRLTADVNDRLTAMLRYHGELSRSIDDALRAQQSLLSTKFIEPRDSKARLD